jgi:hypothetical protein
LPRRDETPRPEPRGLRLGSGSGASTTRPYVGPGRNTETRTEGIATPEPTGLLRNEEPGRTRPPAANVTKHRDPNRGDCDVPAALAAVVRAPASLDETPRPEPRGLRHGWSPALPFETPRPEPRGLRQRPRRNTETRTEGIATLPPPSLRTPSKAARSGRNTETRTEGIATPVRSDHRQVPGRAHQTKHRDPNRGDCDRPSPIRTKHRDPNRGDCDPAPGTEPTDETPRPEPRGLRLVFVNHFVHLP